MNKEVKLGFEKQGITLKLESILPIKTVKEGYKKTKRYQRIKSSMEKVGNIEPFIVYPQKGMPGSYILLEGHTRLEILKEFGISEVYCLISTDDESYTYNHKVNRLAPIQEHFMILKAVEDGVSEERIALTLDINIQTIRAKRNLLQGICPEAVNLLKNCSIGQAAVKILKKVHPIRQVEMAELMLNADNFTTAYAHALLVGTHNDLLLEPEKSKNVKGLAPEQMIRMEKDLGRMSREFKMLEADYGPNMLNFVLACRYLSRLLDNARVVRWLSTHRPDLLAEFQRLVEATSLEM